ncbi:MAG TPA: Zn-ribbon domain-containing OB-fold protein [Acidimicrobiia bacterium]|nr:Zn-ribbon domain-containing OB-fold protein [Acidimicrobiia bacterium]
MSPDPRFPRDSAELPKPRPERTPTSAPFWDALDAEQVRIQRCDACGAWVHYPRNRCPHCLSDRLAWHDVSGHGKVLTFTVARQPTARPFADEVPQLLAVIELDEGVRMTTTLVGVEPDEITVGMPVVPVFDHGTDGVTLLRFSPE